MKTTLYGIFVATLLSVANAQLTQKCTSRAKSVPEAFTCIHKQAILKKDYFQNFTHYQNSLASSEERAAFSEVCVL
jgi:hypothetical protein